jgi:hypothetical protein
MVGPPWVREWKPGDCALALRRHVFDMMSKRDFLYGGFMLGDHER